MPPSQHALAPLTILNWLLAGGAFSVVSIGVGELFVPRKKPITYITSALGLSFGLAVLIYLMQDLGLYKAWPGILYLYYPLELLTGSLLFFFFTLLVERDFPIRSPYLLLFLPVLIVTGLMMPYFLQAPAAKIAQLPIYKTDSPFFHSVYLFIYHNLETWVIGAITLFLVRTWIRLGTGKLHWKPKSGVIMAFAVIFFGVLLFYIWVNFHPSEFVRKLSILVSIVIVYPLYFFQQRNLELFGLSVDEGGKGKYRDSTKLAGMDTARIIERLDRLMEEEKPYKDSSLNLARLSERLGLTPHQLSEILNARLQTNFRQYINRFRIQAAMEDLLETPERTILEIAFECGFGSKSAFNSAFSQATGKTPREWMSEERKHGEAAKRKLPAMPKHPT